MMTYKKKLVKFVKLKRAHIKKFGFVYADHKDYENIRSWPEEMCEWVYNEIVNRITSIYESIGLSDTTCPWCVYHNIESYPCLSCSYGKRYGRCFERGSLYQRYATQEVKDYFTNEVYRDMIYKIES